MSLLAKEQGAAASLSVDNSANVVAVRPQDDGTYDADLSYPYPYINIYYDFNRAYYHNQDYTYLSSLAKGNRGTKRKRTTSVFVGLNLQLPDLPDDLLAAVADFLPKTSVALFAVAIAHANNGRPSTTSDAIIASCAGGSRKSPWEIIDFLDIEKCLRVRLTDADLYGILTCVDAVSNTKKLKLTHCIKVTGLGLDPLRRSVVLEQLDLSQVAEHELPYSTGCMQRICEETVLPVLNSILDSNGALKHLQFPERWLASASCALHTFLAKYDAFLSARETCCLLCKVDFVDYDMICTAGNNFGLQMRTCYSCVRTICGKCEDNLCLDICVQCKKVYCDFCNPVVYCELCDNQSCVGCGLVDNYCHGCNMHYCDFCEH